MSSDAGSEVPAHPSDYRSRAPSGSITIAAITTTDHLSMPHSQQQQEQHSHRTGSGPHEQDPTLPHSTLSVYVSSPSDVPDVKPFLVPNALTTVLSPAIQQATTYPPATPMSDHVEPFMPSPAVTPSSPNGDSNIILGSYPLKKPSLLSTTTTTVVIPTPLQVSPSPRPSLNSSGLIPASPTARPNLPHNPSHASRKHFPSNRASSMGSTLPKPTPPPQRIQHKSMNKLSANKFHFPVFKPDGDLDLRYLNQQHVRRKRIMGKYLIFFSLAFLLLEIPYILHPNWQIAHNYIPIILRVANLALISVAVFANTFIYVARFITQTTERFDFMLLVLMLSCSLFLCVMETQRQMSDPTDPTASYPSAMDDLLKDGLLMGLSVVYAFTFGILKIRWFFIAIHGIASMVIYGLCMSLAHIRSNKHIAISIIFQVLLTSSFTYKAVRNEFVKHQTVNSQKLQYLERKKAEKLLRSMLPVRILSDYLDGSIGQLQANATIGFVQMHLGSLPYDGPAGPPGTHQPTNSISSPGELMQKLHDTFKRIDGIVAMYAIRGVNKIETVSTTYLLCAGLLEPVDDHAAAMVDVCLEMMNMVTTRLNVGGAARRIPVFMRIGLSSGPVVGGIIGAQRRFFRVFGDTVNVAARMCTNVTMGNIQISPSCYGALSERQRAAYKIPPGTLLNIKGKGQMMCYRIESRADWVPKYSKMTMNRGSQDRDEPLLNKSFVYHKLMDRTELSRFTLNYQQDSDAAAFERQTSFVKNSAAAATEAHKALASMHHSSVHMHHQNAFEIPGVLSKSIKKELPESRTGNIIRQLTFRMAKVGEVSAALNAAVEPSHRRLMSRPMSASSVGSMGRSGGAGAVSAGNADLNSLKAIVDKTPSPFSSVTIEKFFQKQFAQDLVRDVQFSTVIFGIFVLALLVYVITDHHSVLDPTTGLMVNTWDASDRDSISPVTLASILLFFFLLYDLWSLVCSAWFKFSTKRKRDSERSFNEGETATATNTTDSQAHASINNASSSGALAQPHPIHAHNLSAGSGLMSGRSKGFSINGNSGLSSIRNAVSKSSPQQANRGTLPVLENRKVEKEVDHFLRNFHKYSFAFAVFQIVWVLIALRFWGVDDPTTQIKPVFACIAVLYYLCFHLRLQFVYLAPLSAAGLLVFLVLLIVERTNYRNILLIMFHLTMSLVVGLASLYYAERTQRSHFLLAYSLEREQEYMDHFLNNLLPKDVVLVLKKQNPAFAREVVGGQLTTPRPLFANGNSPSNTLGIGIVPPSSSPANGRPNMMRLPSTQEGGLASRFAMHFPQTTVFESDIVGYTKMVSSLSPVETLNLLNLIFSRFDQVAAALSVEKIETIGDAFMCMVFDGPPDPVLDFAMIIVGVLQACSAETVPRQNLQIRMGICTGSCFGGIVGTDVPRFHLFGQAHDVAIHIEQHGRPGDIIVSSSTQQLSSDRYDYIPLDLIVDEYQTFQLIHKKGDEDLLDVYDMDDALTRVENATNQLLTNIVPPDSAFISIREDDAPASTNVTPRNRGPSPQLTPSSSAVIQPIAKNRSTPQPTVSANPLPSVTEMVVTEVTLTASLHASDASHSPVIKSSSSSTSSSTPVAAAHRSNLSSSSINMKAVGDNHRSSTPLVIISNQQFLQPEEAVKNPFFVV